MMRWCQTQFPQHVSDQQQNYQQTHQLLACAWGKQCRAPHLILTNHCKDQQVKACLHIHIKVELPEEQQCIASLGLDSQPSLSTVAPLIPSDFLG